MEQCRFCLSNNLLDDAPLFENEAFYVLGMKEPDRQHALMIVAKSHSKTPFEIAGEDWASIAEPLNFAKDALAKFNPSGYSIGWNVGAAAGQHVNHVHLHVICRFEKEPSTGMGINALIQRANNET
ncbi:MAG: HIT family protein [Pseudomonadota bacterium]